MSKTRKPPALPTGNPVVRRTLALAGLGLAACSGGSQAQPPQVVPPAPPPMVLERGEDEDAELAPAPATDAGVTEFAEPPDGATTEERQLDSRKIDDQKRKGYPPQVAPDPVEAERRYPPNPPPMIPNRNPPMIENRPDPPMIPNRPVPPKKR